MRWIALFALLIAMAAGLAWYGLQARWFTEPVWPYLHLAKSAVLVAIAALVTGLLGRLGLSDGAVGGGGEKVRGCSSNCPLYGSECPYSI